MNTDILAHEEENLLIAPLMELKYISLMLLETEAQAFNRTAYGIEISENYPDPVALTIAFNRTAYGIEI